MIIYKITNLINNKMYIGQTCKSLKSRWKQHCQINRKRKCPLILAAIIKYGKNNFNIEILEVCDSKEQLNKREQYWIYFFNSMSPNGYNLTSGGDRGKELSQESKLKISNKLKGRPNGKKGIKTGQIPWNKNKPWSKEIKNKLSIAHKGQGLGIKRKPFSEQHKEKLSKSRLGKPNVKRYKSVLCLNNDKQYSSLKEAAKELNLHTSKICAVLKGKIDNTKGYKFIYLNIKK